MGGKGCVLRERSKGGEKKCYQQWEIRKKGGEYSNIPLTGPGTLTDHIGTVTPEELFRGGRKTPIRTKRWEKGGKQGKSEK